jgi:hypothetical protein
MDDTARRINDAIGLSVEAAINDVVDHSVQFSVDEGLRTIPDADPRGLAVMHPVEHVSRAVEAAIADAVVAGPNQAALVLSVTRAVLAHPRVLEAVKAVETVAAEVAAERIRRLQR